jgi:hypothetical protein
MARGASEPPALLGQVEMQIDQYGSNMGKSAPWPVPLVVLEQARAAEGARGRQGSPVDPPAVARAEPPMSPPVDSSTLLTTGSDYDSDDSLGSPAKNKSTGLEAEEEGGEVDDMGDLDDRCAHRPVLMETTVPRARRTKTMPAGPARKNARLQGPASAIPIMQRAQEFTAAKNLDPTGTIPPPPSASDFVRSLHAGGMSSMTSSLSNNSTRLDDQVCFGSINFSPHPPALLPAIKPAIHGTWGTRTCVLEPSALNSV